MTPNKPPVPPQPSIPPLPIIPPQPSRPPLPPQPSLTSRLSSPSLITPQTPSGISQSLVPVISNSNWVVTPEEKAKADILFQQTDLDKDGFVSGFEIKDVFLQYGVPQPVLAHIWSLCDTHQIGKLNNEQFALAIWLINQKVKGIEPPATLTPEMVPPCMRNQSSGIEEMAPVPTYSNPELEIIANDIAQLTKEKNTLEADIAQKEADIKIKNGEIKNLQSEIETLAATLKQLEHQKGEAQKRLNDLKAQKSSIELELNDLIIEVETEQCAVDKLRSQAAEQEESLRSQENELSSKKQELENLKEEENRLEKKQEETKKILEDLGKTLQDSQLQISQIKSKITQLEEIQRQMNDAIAVFDTALAANDASTVPESLLSIGPDFRDPEIAKLIEIEKEANDNTFSNINGTNGFNNDTFPDDAFSNNTGNAFDDDPFSSAFKDSKKSKDDGFEDPFSALGTTNTLASDPFDPFGDGSGNKKIETKTPVDLSDKDPFGCDPFANLHAPERSSSHSSPARPESPSPALPPKKSKQPPPRPAPPRPVQPNMRAAPVPPTPSPDSTSVNTSQSLNAGGFANFADFDSKLMNKSEPKLATRGLRPDSKSPLPTHSQSTSPENSSAVIQNRYAAFEFTEDPFKNYRYDDLDNIDPFNDDDTGADKNKNISSDRNLFKFDDDLAYETPIGGEKEAFEAKFPKVDAFELTDFSFDKDASVKMDKVNGNAVGLFSNFEHGFSDRNSNSTSSDPFQSKKDEKVVISKISGVSKAEKNEAGNGTGTGIGMGVINDDDLLGIKKMADNKVNLKSMPNEEMQLSWAAKESLKLEEERLRQEAQEKADYEYALALSKKDSNKDKKTIKNLLRLGRNTPTA